MPRAQNGLRGSTHILRVSQPEFYRILSLTLVFWVLIPRTQTSMQGHSQARLAPLDLEDLSSVTPVPVFTNQGPTRPHRVAS